MGSNRKEVRLCFETAEYVQITEAHEFHSDYELTFNFKCEREEECPYAYDHCTIYKDKQEAIRTTFPQAIIITSK